MELKPVENLNPFLLNQIRTNNTEAKNARRNEKPLRNSFFSLLKETIYKDAVFDLEKTSQDGQTTEEIVDNLRSAGDALKKNPRPGEIKAYRDAVQTFIKYVLQNGFEVQEKMGIKRINKPQIVRTNIKIIDKKLEQLAAAVMTGQVEQIKLLASIDEISGLLVNLLE
ncbi:MAG: YaaR family protein [Spirochaetaceae bacterium]|nr:YaaR family protein [Spirochaetaceae bacterium]GMO27530.1 MAG: YaaR family protein [Termitinemataceae bacterium]